MHRTLPLVATALLFSGSARAQFIDNTADIPSGHPFNNSRTENVDFCDVDLDGDWDAAFADGGDGGNDQNRLWVNQGGLQGGTVGVFLDRTATQFPVMTDTSRDVEFGDVDGDADFDLYIANTSSITNQPSRWWINQGGAQGGTTGFYDDETAARWVGLGGPGSSLAAFMVLPSGGFIDWVGDGEFADLDNDGDLDLVHSSYGSVMSGETPLRLFLNDGDGFFSEFNPSGFQLSGSQIQNGDPGLWCEGTQQQNTLAIDGSACDIASSALDTDVADLDGDFDLDLLQGARDQEPRIFANRLDRSGLAPDLGGQLGFRDVTHLALPPGYSQGGGNYEQELGDLDGDGDLDIYGLDWILPLFSDAMFENDGAGIFAPAVPVPSSNNDANEADFFDFDNDGDLDVVIANFSGQDKLYAGNGMDMNLVDVTGLLPPLTHIGVDAEAADVDSDGDYDIFVANDANQPNNYVQNVSGTPDTHAPYLPNVESAPDRLAGSAPTVVRAHVYDNAPYYVTWYNDVWVEVTVAGGAPATYPAASSGGQVFRAEIPGDLVGNVCYRFLAQDDYGNRGQSGEACFAGQCVTSPFCSSTPNSTGAAALLSSNGDCAVANNGLVLSASPVPNQNGIFFYSAGQQAGGAGIPFGNGLLCVGGGGPQVFRLPVDQAAGNELTHAVDLTAPPSASGTITPGATWHFQCWFRDPAAGGAFFDLSNALTITFQ